MKKIMCDICGKETENGFEYKLPDIKETSLYDVLGTKLKTLWYTIEDEIKDVCPECRQKSQSCYQVACLNSKVLY